MLSEFDWDKRNWPKCAKHGVSKDEIEYIFKNSPMVLPDRKQQDMETRYNGLGKTKEGRMIFIVFALRKKDSLTRIRPISARYMHKKEIQRYERTKRT